MSLFENVHWFWILSSYYFYYFFHKLKLVIFMAKMTVFKVFCAGNSYIFMPIPLTHYRCLGHGLKMYI